MFTNSEGKISVDIYNPNEAEELIRFIDWENFNHKTWRFFQKVLRPEFGGSAGYSKEIWAKLNAKKQEVVTKELALAELKKYVSKERFEKYCLPVIESWDTPQFSYLEEWQKVDSIFSAVSKDAENNFLDDGEAWATSLSNYIYDRNKEDSESFG